MSLSTVKISRAFASTVTPATNIIPVDGPRIPVSGVTASPLFDAASRS
jgi:hypothetical protein